MKKKKVNSKNALESVPSEGYKSVEHHKSHNAFKNSSMMKQHHKIESPIMSHGKNKKGA